MVSLLEEANRDEAIVEGIVEAAVHNALPRSFVRSIKSLQ